MKKILMLSGLLLMLITTQAQFTKARLQASGLTCALCTKAIDNALKKIAFVAAVKPDIKTSSFNIDFKAGAEIDADLLRKAVEDAGFFISDLKLTGNFDKVAVANDEHILFNGRHYHFVSVKNQVLTGEQTITVIDKNFLPAKDFKKKSAATAMSCIKTGQAGTCCKKAGITANTRIYHVTI